ncbi:hypothetical protein [Maribacter luteus]|nr:hypothetical protein [Maribacter luteus]
MAAKVYKTIVPKGSAFSSQQVCTGPTYRNEVTPIFKDPRETLPTYL